MFPPTEEETEYMHRQGFVPSAGVPGGWVYRVNPAVDTWFWRITPVPSGWYARSYGFGGKLVGGGVILPSLTGAAAFVLIEVANGK